MADSIQIPIQIITKEALDQIKKFSRNTESSLKGINSSTRKISSSFEGVRSSLNSLSGVAKIAGGVLVTALAGRALISGIETLIDKANQFESSLIGVRSVAANFGITATEITETVESLASDGLVPVQDVASSLKNLLATGLNIEESTKLFLTLKDAAAFGRQGFLDLGQAIEGATQGIKNGQSTLVDNAGITKNLSVLQKEYAQSIGTTIGKLTEAQKIQAIYQGILREGAIFSGDAARLQETYTGAVSKLTFAFSKLQVRLGQFVTRSPAVIKIISVLAERFVLLTDFVDNNSEQISETIKRFSIGFVNSIRTVIDVIDFWERGFRIIPRFVAKVFIDAKNIVIESIDTMIGGINEIIKLVGIDPFERYTDSINELSKASDIASKEINDIVTEQTTLQTISENLLDVSKALEEIEPTADLDKLNKQIKTTADVSDSANDNIKTLSDESIQFLERIGSRFSKVTADIEQSLGKVGQSIKSALDFTFGTGSAQQKRELEQLEKDLEEAFSKGKITKDAFETRQSDLKKLRKKLEENSQLAFSTGLLNSFARGSQGATELVTGLSQLAFDAFVPGLGQAAGPLLDVFAQGPEATKAAFNQFAQAVPTVIENIILSIPAAIEAIADNVDKIIIAIVDRVDEIVLALVRAMPRVSTALAVAFAVEVPIALAKSLPQTLIDLARGFSQAIIDAFRTSLTRLGTVFSSLGRVIVIGLKDALDGLFGKFIELGKNILNGFKNSIGTFFYDLGKTIFSGFIDAIKSAGGVLGEVSIGGIDLGGGLIGGIVGGGVGSIAGAVGGLFAKGGIVPDGFPNDTFPARLTSGEFVIDRSTTADLQEFLTSQSNQNASNATIESLLAQLVGLMRSDQKISTTVEFRDDVLADIILNLSRNNARLA